MSDLISKSALKKAFKAALLYGIFASDSSHVANQLNEGFKLIKEVLDDQPTIDAVPVVHARLKETGWDEAWCQWGDCTKCGHSNIIGSKYCNQCGAKLDGGEEG